MSKLMNVYLVRSKYGVRVHSTEADAIENQQALREHRNIESTISVHVVDVEKMKSV